jgi:hypothetical protein
MTELPRRLDDERYDAPGIVLLGSVDEVTRGAAGPGGDFEFTASPTVCAAE